MNKPINWNTIVKAMPRDTGETARTDKETFWGEFRARARMTHQDEVATATPWIPVWRWATAAACTLLVVAGLSYSWIATPDALSQIDSVEVVASHSALLIMEDVESQSTMVWVVDMKPGGTI